jgi:hypothetical protein
MAQRPRNRISTAGFTAAIVAAAAIAGAAAQRATGAVQRGGNTEESRPGRLTRRVADTVWRGATAGESATIMARWSLYDRLFTGPDSLARPQGFTFGPFASGSLTSPPFDVPHLEYSFTFYQGLITTRGEGTALLWVVEDPSARDVWVLDSGGPNFSDGQGEMFLERPKAGPVPGVPANAVVFDHALQFGSTNKGIENRIRVLLTADGELPWSDVSRERVLRILIAKAEAELKKVEHYASDSSYEKWLRDAPARQRSRDEMLAGVAAVDKSQVAKLRADLERAERETAESMKKNEPEQHEQMGRALALVKGKLTQVSGDLAAMSAAERATAAWIQLTSEGTYKFAAAGTPGFQHLISDKPDYYRFNGSRTRPRAILVGFGLTNGFNAQMDRAVADSYHAFDWAAVARLLDPPTK